MFSLYLKLGFEHILDINGYDHILFLAALCLIYTFKDIKKVIILATAFTVGHSVSLALATLQLVKVPGDWIEFLIPVTIILTVIFNLISTYGKKLGSQRASKYFVALFFGLIHGLGFSNYLRALLGTESSIFMPLLAFNLGLEIGQIVIVICYLLLATYIIPLCSFLKKYFFIAASLLIAGISLMMIFQRLPF